MVQLCIYLIKRDILMRKLGIANVISKSLRPKLRTANSIKKFLIVPLKAVTPVPFPPRSKIRPKPCPGWSQIVYAEGSLGISTGIFSWTFCSVWLPQQNRTFSGRPLKKYTEKMRQNGLSGSNPAGPSYFSVGGQLEWIRNFAEISHFCKILLHFCKMLRNFAELLHNEICIHFARKQKF
jgi:hypothetical protein